SRLLDTSWWRASRFALMARRSEGERGGESVIELRRFAPVARGRFAPASLEREVDHGLGAALLARAHVDGPAQLARDESVDDLEAEPVRALDPEALGQALAAVGDGDAEGVAVAGDADDDLALLSRRVGVLDGVLDELVDDHDQRRGVLARQHPEGALAAELDLRLGHGDLHGHGGDAVDELVEAHRLVRDRKNTRLNSRHV